MKSLAYVVLAASLLAAPVASFAQSNAPLTRSQVQGQLVQLEQAGYKVDQSGPHYPSQILAAQARVDAQSATANAGSSEGASIYGSSQSGSSTVASQSTYFGS